MDKAYIYGLVDPRDRKIHYVGHSTAIHKRLDGHLSDTSVTPKTAWLAELVALGLKPVMVELDAVDYRKSP